MLFLVSLLIALVLWLMNSLGREYTGVVNVPVVASCSIEGHSALSSNSATVSARCRTTGYQLLRSGSRKNVIVRFDKADLHPGPGDNFYIVGNAKNSYISQFFGDRAQVEAFISDTLSFLFPAENHKKVPVELEHDISYRAQFMSSAPIRIQPDSVMVYGEPGRLDAVQRVKTARLSLDDVHQGEHGMLKLMPVKGVRVSEEEVSYELSVSRYVEVRSTLPVEVWNAPAGKSFQVFPSQAEVVLRCMFPVSRDPFGQFKLYIDYKDFASSLTGRCVPRTLRLPAGVLDYRLEPEIFDCIELD